MILSIDHPGYLRPRASPRRPDDPPPSPRLADASKLAIGRTSRGRPPAPIGVRTVWAMQVTMLIVIVLRHALS